MDEQPAGPDAVDVIDLDLQVEHLVPAWTLDDQGDDRRRSVGTPQPVAGPQGVGPHERLPVLAAAARDPLLRDATPFVLAIPERQPFRIDELTDSPGRGCSTGRRPT